GGGGGGWGRREGGGRGGSRALSGQERGPRPNGRGGATCHASSVASGGGWVRDSFVVPAGARRLLGPVPPPTSLPRIPSTASMRPLSLAPFRRQFAAGAVAGSP